MVSIDISKTKLLNYHLSRNCEVVAKYLTGEESELMLPRDVMPPVPSTNVYLFMYLFVHTIESAFRSVSSCDADFNLLA